MENRDLLKIKKYASIVGIVILAIIARLIPHLPNMAPIAALALFSGAHLSKKFAVVIAISAMFLSDIFLGFHKTIPFVYGSFIAIIFIGSFLKNHQKGKYILGATLLSSILFFIVTNFGVWLVEDLYTKNISGLYQAYFMALPFFRNTLLGDLSYTFSFFYGYKVLEYLLHRERFVKLEF